MANMRKEKDEMEMEYKLLLKGKDEEIYSKLDNIEELKNHLTNLLQDKRDQDDTMEALERENEVKLYKLIICRNYLSKVQF
jgi:hypothetical protein